MGYLFEFLLLKDTKKDEDQLVSRAHEKGASTD